MASNHKQTTISYALGYIEDFVENKTEPLTIHPDDSEDPKYGAYVIEENEHREQVREMLSVLVRGLTQLSRENAALLQKVAMAKSALDS